MPDTSLVYFFLRVWYNEATKWMELRILKFDNTHVTIDLDKIAENFRVVSQQTGVPVLAMATVRSRLPGSCRMPAPILAFPLCWRRWSCAMPASRPPF